MNLSRRKAHFYAVLGLSCTLPLVFLAGLAWRPAIPTVDDAPEELFAATNFATANSSDAVVASEVLSVQGISVRVDATGPVGQDLFLQLQPSQPLQFADVLVYWVAGETPPETPPETAVLLGQLSGTSRRIFPVPEAIREQPGQLLFYSRGQSTVIDTAVLPPNLFP